MKDTLKKKIVEHASIKPEDVRDITKIVLGSRGASREIGKFIKSILDYEHSIDRLLFLGKLKLHLDCYTNHHYSSRSLDSVVLHPNYPSCGIYFSTSDDKCFMRYCPETDSQKDLVRICPIGDNRNDIVIGGTGITTEIQCPPSIDIYGISCISREDSVILEDRRFWESITKPYSLKLKKTEPGYFDKDPVTPWYITKDEISGAILNVGGRFRVDEINIKFAYPIDIKQVKGQINEAFKTENVTKYWSKGNKYKIHSHKPRDTENYLSKLLEIARRNK